MSKLIRWSIRLLFITFMVYISFNILYKRSFYNFLLLNTFLAYIPIEISMHINEKQPKEIYYPLLILWILFYPNAPYVLTDLFHLSSIYPFNSQTGLMVFNLHMWFHFENLLFSSLLCGLFGIWSLTYISKIIMVRINKKGNLFNIIITTILIFLSSIGVFVGRFLRLHTIYLFIDPKNVVEQLIYMWNDKMLTFVIMISVIQLLIWIIMNIYKITFQT